MSTPLLSTEDLKIIMDEIARKQAKYAAGMIAADTQFQFETALDKYNALKDQNRRLTIVVDLLKEIYEEVLSIAEEVSKL